MKYLFTASLLVNGIFGWGQDKSLDFFIQQARQNSPVIRDYENQVLSLKIDSQLLRASLRTQVNLISTDSYAPVVHGWGYDPAISNIANITGLVQANRNFFTPGNVALQYRTIALQSRALLDTIRLSERDLVRTISEQYITAYGDLLAVDFSKEVFDLMKSEEEMLKKLTEASVFKQTDYLNFYVTLQQQELNYLQAQIQYNTDYLTLNYLAGLVDTFVTRLRRPDIPDVRLQTDLYRSVFINRFVTDSLRIQNERALIAYQYKPKLGAYTDAGYTSSLQDMPYKNFGFSFGLSLSFPIYDGHQRQLKYARINIQERTRQFKRQFFINQYNQQVAQLRQQLRATETLVAKISQQISYAHTLILANNKLLETGDITMRDYVNAINNYLNAQNLLTQNNISRLRIINQINYWNR